MSSERYRELVARHNALERWYEHAAPQNRTRILLMMVETLAEIDKLVLPADVLAEIEGDGSDAFPHADAARRGGGAALETRPFRVKNGASF